MDFTVGHGWHEVKEKETCVWRFNEHCPLRMSQNLIDSIFLLDERHSRTWSNIISVRCIEEICSCRFQITFLVYFLKSWKYYLHHILVLTRCMLYWIPFFIKINWTSQYIIRDCVGWLFMVMLVTIVQCLQGEEWFHWTKSFDWKIPVSKKIF